MEGRTDLYRLGNNRIKSLDPRVPPGGIMWQK